MIFSQENWLYKLIYILFYAPSTKLLQNPILPSLSSFLFFYNFFTCFLYSFTSTVVVSDVANIHFFILLFCCCVINILDQHVEFTFLKSAAVTNEKFKSKQQIIMKIIQQKMHTYKYSYTHTHTKSFIDTWNSHK